MQRCRRDPKLGANCKRWKGSGERLEGTFNREPRWRGHQPRPRCPTFALDSDSLAVMLKVVKENRSQCSTRNSFRPPRRKQRDGNAHLTVRVSMIRPSDLNLGGSAQRRRKRTKRTESLVTRFFTFGHVKVPSVCFPCDAKCLQKSGLQNSICDYESAPIRRQGDYA